MDKKEIIKRIQILMVKININNERMAKSKLTVYKEIKIMENKKISRKIDKLFRTHIEMVKQESLGRYKSRV